MPSPTYLYFEYFGPVAASNQVELNIGLGKCVGLRQIMVIIPSYIIPRALMMFSTKKCELYFKKFKFVFVS